MPKYNIAVSVDSKGVVTGARVGGQAMEDMGRKSKRAAQALNLVKIAATGLAVGAGYKLTQWARQSVAAATEQAQAFAQVEQAVISTGGAAGKTAEQLADLASDLQKITLVGDEVTLRMESLLLTFKSIGGEVFDRTALAILDMSERMGSLESNALLLGKALDAPADRARDLSRSGIVLSEVQLELIDRFEELGNRAAAQNIILTEVESQFGGAAEAAANAAGGGIKQLTNAIGDLQEEFGKGVVKSLDDMSRHMKTIAENGEAAEAVRLLGEAVGALLTLLGGVVLAFGQVQKAINKLGQLVGEPIGKILVGFGLATRKVEETAEAMGKLVAVTERFTGTSSEGSGIAGLDESLAAAAAAAEDFGDKVDDSADKIEAALSIYDEYQKTLALIREELEVVALAEPEDFLALPEHMTDALGNAIEAGDWIPDEPPSQWKDLVNQMGAMMQSALMNALSDATYVLLQFAMGNLEEGELTDAFKQIGGQIGETAGFLIGSYFGGPIGGAIGSAIGQVAGEIIGEAVGGVIEGLFDNGPRALGSGGFGEKAGTVGGTAEAQEVGQAMVDEWERIIGHMNEILNDTLEVTAQAFVHILDNGQAVLELIDNATGETLFEGTFESIEEAFNAAVAMLFETSILHAEGPIADAMREVMSRAVEIGAEAALEQLETLADIQSFLDENLGGTMDPLLQQLADYREAIEEMGLSAEITADILADLAEVEARRTAELERQTREQGFGLMSNILDMAERLGIQNIDFAKQRFAIEKEMMKIDIERFRLELKRLELLSVFWKKLIKKIKKLIDDLELPDDLGDVGDLGGVGSVRVGGGGRGRGRGRRQSRADFMDRLMGMLGRGAKDLNREFRDLLGNLADMYAEARRLKLPLGEVQAVMRQIVREFGQQAFQGVSDFLSDLRGPGGAGGGTLAEQFGSAQRAFADTMRRAQGGDLNAVQALPGAAQALLDLGQQMFGSTAQFNALVAMVESSLTSVLGQQNAILDRAAGQHQATLDAIGFQTETLATIQTEGNAVLERQERKLGKIERRLHTQNGILEQIAAAL